MGKLSKARTIPGNDYWVIKCKHCPKVIQERKGTIAGRNHLERCHTDLANKVMKKETTRKRKNDLETEELASAVKEAEEYKRHQDVNTTPRKLMTEYSSKKPISSFMEMKLLLFDCRQLEIKT